MAHWKPAQIHDEGTITGTGHKRLYNLRRTSGVCVYCGKNEAKGRASCPECADKRYGAGSRRKSRRLAASKIRICVSCLKAESAQGRRCCGYCLEYHQEATERSRVRAKAIGRCSGCFTRYPEPGGKTCGVCRERNRSNRAKIRSKMKGVHGGRTRSKNQAA